MYAETLARHGWEVTGVDIVDRALARARGRLVSSGPPATIVKADAAKLSPAVVAEGFDPVLDVGCFHSIGHGRRASMTRGHQAVHAGLDPADARVRLAGRTGVRVRRSTREQIQAAYAASTVVEVVRPDTRLPGLPRIARNYDPTFYRLLRRPAP